MTLPSDPELDALVAAPEHHKLLLENEAVRVLETRIEPGSTTRLHTHRWPATHYFISFSDFVRRDERGVIAVDTRQTSSKPRPGQAVWSGPLGPHTLENVGEAALHVISVEIK